MHLLGHYHRGGPLSISFDVLSSAFKYGNRCFTKYPADMPDFFEQAFPAWMSYERTVKIWGWRSCSYHLILEEYGSSLIGSLKEDPSHFPLTYCRQRSNMETDASPNTLPTCPTFSNKHFLLECLMKRPLKFEDGGVAPIILFQRNKEVHLLGH